MDSLSQSVKLVYPGRNCEYVFTASIGSESLADVFVVIEIGIDASGLAFDMTVAIPYTPDPCDIGERI